MGSQPSPQEQVIAQQAAALNGLATQRYQLGDHVALLSLEAMEIWCQLASQLGSPQRGAAKQQIERYVRVTERMRALAAGITVVGQLPEDANGGT